MATPASSTVLLMVAVEASLGAEVEVLREAIKEYKERD